MLTCCIAESASAQTYMCVSSASHVHCMLHTCCVYAAWFDACLHACLQIRFRVPLRVERLLLDVRAQLLSLLTQKIERPSVEFSTAGKGRLHVA